MRRDERGRGVPAVSEGIRKQEGGEAGERGN